MNPQVGQTINLPGGIASGVAPGGGEYKTGAGMTKIIGTRNVGGQNYYNIDQSGIGGGTGWVAAASLSSPAPAPAAPQQSQPQQSNNAPAPTMAPPPTPFDLVGATNAAYNTPELVGAQKAVDDANGLITTRQQALAEAQAKINDNPFYSEATRVGKSQQLTQQANNDISVIQNTVTQAQNKQASLKADAAIKVNAALGQYNINRQSYQDTLSQFNMILQAGGLTNASPQDLANYSQATGMSYSVLQSIQQQEQQKNITTQVIPSTDDNGNVTLTTVNTKTGQVINQTTAGQVSTKTTTKSTGNGQPTAYDQKQQMVELKAGVYSDLRRLSAPDTGFVSKEDWAKVKTNAIAQGYDPSQFNSDFAGFTNPNGAKNGYYYN